MAIESTVYTALTGDATIGGIVSTRVYPVTAPDNRTFPLIVYSVISGVPAGSTGWVRSRVQLDMYATTYAVVKSLRDAVQVLADATGHWTYIGGIDDFEETENIYRQVVDLIIIHEV